MCGTEKILSLCLEKKSFLLVGGGNTVSLIKKKTLDKKVDFLSTAGGSALKFLSEGDLDGLKVLSK